MSNCLLIRKRLATRTDAHGMLCRSRAVRVVAVDYLASLKRSMTMLQSGTGDKAPQARTCYYARSHSRGGCSFNHGNDVIRNLAAAYGTNVMVSSGSELSTGLLPTAPATPSVATHDGNNLAFMCS